MTESTVAAAGKGAAGTAATKAAATKTAATKAGLGTKMLAFATSAPAIGLIALVGIITYEFWKGGKEAEQMKTA
jgi:hypothetical protein